jgi:hypothetical protein
VLPLERVSEEPLERVVELPLERVELPVLRLRLSCWLADATERVAGVALERDALLEEPEERVAELPEELRVEEELLWVERVAPLFPRERLWAIISGAVIMAMAITREAAYVINLFIAS